MLASAPATGGLPTDEERPVDDPEAAPLVGDVELRSAVPRAARPVDAEAMPVFPVGVVAVGWDQGAVAGDVVVPLEVGATDVWIGRFVSLRCGERVVGVLPPAVPAVVGARTAEASGVWR